MTKREKRLQKLRQNPKAVTKAELEGVLLDYGFKVRQGKGSHTVYKHPDLPTPVVVAAHQAHVPVYVVKQVLAAIEQITKVINFREEQDDENS